jgi:hypothetical protein
MGTHKYKNGDYYKGGFRHGLWEGQGTLFLKRSFHQGKVVNNFLYEGQFSRGKKHGVGM